MTRPSTLPGRALRLLLPVLVILAGVAITAVLIATRPQPAASPNEERITPVETLTVRNTDVTFTITSQGEVQPRRETIVVAEVSGRVDDVADGFVRGGFFQEGDTLLTVDAADYQVAVTQARAALLSAQAQLAQEQAQADQAAREWDLSGRPREEAPPLSLRTPFLREAEARVLQAESELQRAERQLDRTTVRAPYDALIREKSAELGQYLNTGSQIARLFATDEAEVRLPLSSADLEWLDLPAPGQEVPAGRGLPVVLETTIAGTRQQWQARIVRTEGVIDSSSRMLYAVARIKDPYARGEDQTGVAPLRVGTFVEARLQGRSTRNVVALPHDALYESNQVLLVDAEQRLRIQSVNVLRTDTAAVYIDEGLQEGDRVIISPVRVPVNGMRVNPLVSES